MAQRRMFSLKVIDTDLFLDMPISARLLYYDLSMRADDDGFVASPKKIQRMIGCSDDDIRLLIAKQFIIPFESGICVIRHWRIHNYIRADRHTETIYKYEKEQLIENEGNYELNVIPNVIPNVSQMSYQCQPQVRLGKDRLGKDSIKKEKEVKKTNYDLLIDAYTTNKELKETIYNFIKMRKTIRAALTDYALKLMLKKLSKFADDDVTKIEILEHSVMNSWKDIYKPKEGNNGNGVYGTKSNTGQVKKYNVKPPTTVELTDEDRRRADEELL